MPRMFYIWSDAERRNERKCKYAKGHKRAQTSAKDHFPRKKCKEPGLKQPSLGIPSIERGQCGETAAGIVCLIFGTSRKVFGVVVHVQTELRAGKESEDQVMLLWFLSLVRRPLPGTCIDRTQEWFVACVPKKHGHPDSLSTQHSILCYEDDMPSNPLLSLKSKSAAQREMFLMDIPRTSGGHSPPRSKLRSDSGDLGKNSESVKFRFSRCPL